MKNALTILALSVSLLSCEKQAELPAPDAATVSSNVTPPDGTYTRTRMRFTHGSDCTTPGGICLVAPFRTSGEDQHSDITTTSYARIEGNKLHLIFEHQAATPAGIVPITHDLVVEDWLCHSTVTLKAGNYSPSYASSPFGEIWADVQLD